MLKVLKVLKEHRVIKVLQALVLKVLKVKLEMEAAVVDLTLESQPLLMLLHRMILMDSLLLVSLSRQLQVRDTSLKVCTSQM